MTAFNISVFTSGYEEDSKPSVTLNSTDINTEDTAGGFEEPRGLLINSWGASGAGSLPTNWSKFSSKQIIMPTNLGTQSLFPEWDTNFPYTIGAVVKYTLGLVDKVYKAKGSTQGDRPDISGSDWDEIDIDDYYTTSTTYNTGYLYSPWTMGKAVLWESSMANPDGGGTFGRSMWDANIIVNDGGGNSGGAFRTWADVIATSPSTVTSSKSAWLYDGDTLYDGFRVFVKGSGSGDFSDFDNSIIEYDGEISDCILKYEIKEDMMMQLEVK